MEDIDIKTINNLEGSGGSGKSSTTTRTPVEDPNDLHSKSIVKAIDMIGEGPIEGFVAAIDAGYTDPDSANYLSDAPKSIYFNNVQTKSDSDVWNFGGITLSVEHGTPPDSATPILGFENVESAHSVSTQVTQVGGGIVRTVSDADVDRVRVTLQIPSLQDIDETTGDIKKTSVQYQIQIRPDGGAYVTVVDTTKLGKCTAPYAWSTEFIITDYVAAGTDPWDIKVVRVTADSDSSYLINDLYWSAYDEIKDEKITYPDTALIGVELDAQYFGQQIPSRAYHVYGLKVQVPSNRNYTSPADTGDAEQYPTGQVTYSGVWDGTFKTEWTDCPTWIYYDLLTSTRYGLDIDADYVDKWSLYSAGVYADQLVTVSGVINNLPGTFQERRFVFNYRIENRQEAFHILNYVASCFHAMPFWATGMATVSQDRPTDATRLITRANVEGGDFEYSGTAHKARHTVAYITYNDETDYYLPKVEVVEDFDGIERYGYHIKEIQAYGCTRRGQAQRTGRWLLYSDLNQTQAVKFVGGWDMADLQPGEIIKIADEKYANVRLGGRIVSATAGTVTLDSEIEIEGGESYTIDCTTTSGTIMTRDISDGAGDYTTINVSPNWDETPEAHSVWMITASNLEPREFKILGVVEERPNKFQITGLEHSATKFAEVEDGIQFDPPPTQRTTTGALEPPTGLAGEEYTYSDGASNQQFGYLLSWEHPGDPRIYEYAVQARNQTESDPYTPWGKTGDNWFDLRPVTSGIWDFRVRSEGINTWSTWATLDNVSILADPDPLPDITGLQVKDDGTSFVGRDIDIEWDTVSGTVYRWKDYKMEVYTTGDSLLRRYYTKNESYEYTYEMNLEDNSGTAQRSIKFKAWARDTYDKLSVNAAVLTATNPAPVMTGSPIMVANHRGMRVDWAHMAPADRDLDYYILYFDDVTPPASGTTYDKNTTRAYISGLDPAKIYYARVKPYDLFGAGTQSSISSSQPLGDDIIDVEAELVNSITMTDSEGTTASGLAPLYDFDTTTSGVTYTGTDWKWIQYEFGIEDYIDRIAVSSYNVMDYYFALSSDEVSWSYYNHDADNVLQTVSQTTASGTPCKHVPLTSKWTLPDQQTAKYCKMYFTVASGTYTINELVFARMILGEFVVAGQLDAISANLGSMTAGTLQSTNWAPDEGIFIDLNGEQIIAGGSDNPALEWNGTNMDFTLNGDSQMIVEEGGLITVGSGNIVIDSRDNGTSEGRIIVAENGTIDGNGNVTGNGDYLQLEDGDVRTFKYINGEHRQFKSLNKIVTGVVANNSYVNIGYFPSQPVIQLSPFNLQSYNTAYKLQNQSFRMQVQDIEQIGDGTWRFRPYAQLVLTDGAGVSTVNLSNSTAADLSVTRVPAGASILRTPANTTSFTVNFTYRCYKQAGYVNKYYQKNFYWRVNVDGNWTDWFIETPGSSIDWKNVSRTFSGLSSAAHNIYMEFYGQQGAETFYIGNPVYEYTWDYNTTNYNYAVSVSNGSQGISTSAYPTFGPPSSLGGWTATNNIITTVNTSYSYSLTGAIAVAQMNTEWGQFHSVADCNGYWRNGYIAYCASGGSKSGSNTENWSYKWNKTDRIYLYVNTIGSPSSMWARLNYIKKGREFKREVAGGSTVYNALNWQSYDYVLGSLTILAEGTVNYLAIDGGE